MAHEPRRRPHHPRHACHADASRGSAAYTGGEKCAMPVRLQAERRLLHAHVSSCPCSRPEGLEMPARIRTERQLLFRSPPALTQVRLQGMQSAATRDMLLSWSSTGGLAAPHLDSEHFR